MSAKIAATSFTGSVDSALATLITNAGIKRNARLPNSKMNLFDGVNIFPKDVAVNVSTQLQREKDMNLPHRRELATQVCDVVASELKQVFRGEEEKADATVVVRILLVSDGSSKGSRWKGKGGIGTAKLTLAWFLVHNKSGEVASARQIYLTEDCSPAKASPDLDHLEFSGAAVRSMARNAAAEIEEVLTCDIINWKQNKPTEKKALKKKAEHEDHEVGEEKMTLLNKMMKKLTQI